MQFDWHLRRFNVSADALARLRANLAEWATASDNDKRAVATVRQLLSSATLSRA